MMSEISIREKLKRKHGIVDDKQDEIIEDIIEDAISHYLAIVNHLSDSEISSVPKKHSFIISDVASKRYVRRGSEGMEVERVDGYQAQYESMEKDFNAYLNILEKEYSPENGKSGRLTFY